MTCLQCGYYSGDSEVVYPLDIELGIDRLQQTQEADYLAKLALVA